MEPEQISTCLSAMIMLELLEPREDEGVRESQVKQFAIAFLDKRQAVPHFLFHLFEENTTLHDIFKF